MLDLSASLVHVQANAYKKETLFVRWCLSPMILTCPGCATRYSIDPVTIGPEGRAVRCAKCGHKWREYKSDDTTEPATSAAPAALATSATPAAPAVPALEVEAEPNVEPQPETGLSIEQMTAIRTPAVAAETGPKRGWIGWLLLLVVLAVLAGGAYFARHTVVDLWPETAPLYHALRIDVQPPNRLGLEIHELKTRSVLQDGVTTLTVSGVIRNVTDAPHPLPRIRIALLDAAGQSLYSWTTTVEEPQIMPWGQVEFSSSMNGPPAEAKNVKVDLIDPES